MWYPILPFVLVAAFFPAVNATALTYKLAASEVACFFAEIQPAQVNGKIAFYFAVRSLPLFMQNLPISVSLSSPPLLSKPHFSLFFILDIYSPTTGNTRPPTLLAP